MSSVPDIDLSDQLCIPLNFSRRKEVVVFCHILRRPDAWVGLLRLMLWLAENGTDGNVAELTHALPALTGIDTDGEAIDAALRESGLVVHTGRWVGWDTIHRKESNDYPWWWDHMARMGSYRSPITSVRNQEGEAGAAAQSAPIPAAVREVVLHRDGLTCRYCGKPANQGSPEEIDHVIPRSRGGLNTATNLVVSCRPCNRAKWAFTPEEAGMTMLPVPRVVQ